MKTVPVRWLDCVKAWALLALAATALSPRPGAAGEDLITTARYSDGEEIPYILNYENLSPRTVVILFPGGDGQVNPRLENGRLVYGYRGNFLLRSRKFIIDDEFVTVTTNATWSEPRVQAIINDLKTRFPAAKIYLMGTSRGTLATVRLAHYLADRIAGVIHTASMADSIHFFDARNYSNRQLVVHHRQDGCRVTPFASAERSHRAYGNDFIAMDGGISEGDPCEAFAHHGFHGIEGETIDAIKQWIRRGG